MQLNEYAKVWHKLWSIRLLALTTVYTAAAGAWAVLPVDWKPTFGEGARMVLAGIGVALPALAALAVLVKQQGLLDDKPTPTVPQDKTDA